MKEKNKNTSFAVILGASLIISSALATASNATENPFETSMQRSSYIVADGHKHIENNHQNNQKKEECNPDKGQNCNPPAEIKDSADDGKQKECNPDKGQNCNPPAW